MVYVTKVGEKQDIQKNAYESQSWGNIELESSAYKKKSACRYK